MQYSTCASRLISSVKDDVALDFAVQSDKWYFQVETLLIEHRLGSGNAKLVRKDAFQAQNEVTRTGAKGLRERS